MSKDRESKTSHRLFSMGLAVALMLGGVLAGAEELARERRGVDGIAWTLRLNYDRVLLVVAGPSGEVYRQELDSSPFYDLFDQNGNRLLDGQYTYELRALPYVDPGTMDELQALRDSGNEAALQQMMEALGIADSPTMTGAFTVSGGALVVNVVEENGSPQFARLSTGSEGDLVGPQQVIAEDLMVQGSLCVGMDCTSTESFGFDTIRLKENNLRIKFEDTSTGTFPTNDWQLTANDSANGGANRFSIDDIDNARTPFTIEAAARSNALYVASDGNIGFGTANPSLDLHIVEGNTPATRLEQDGSSGFTAQTWDVAGNESNFFIRDLTNGSKLPFRIRPNAPTSSIDIGPNGVGLGPSFNSGGISPVRALHVHGGSVVQVARFEGNGAETKVEFVNGALASPWAYALSNTDEFRISKQGTGGPEFTVQADGDVIATGNYYAGSTQLDVPDYVFESDYPLMSLDELSSYIEANKHLPNLPSEQEITSLGKLNMTEFQMKLLEKIEELTLYTLEQHETLRTQQERIQELEHRLAALQAQR